MGLANSRHIGHRFFAGGWLSGLVGADDSFQTTYGGFKDLSKQIAYGIQTNLDADREYLLLLAEEFVRGALDEESFQRRASAFVDDHPGLINIVWADTQFIIRWAAPYAPNEQVIGLGLTLPEPERASHAARDSRTPVYTEPFLVIQGPLAIELYVPIYNGRVFLGTFGGIYSIEQILRSAIPVFDQIGYYVAITSESDDVLAQISSGQPVDLDESYKVALDPPGYGMFLHTAYYRSSFWVGWVMLGLIASIFATGIILSARNLGRQLRDSRLVQETMEDLVTRDPLTGIFNRRGIKERVANDVARAMRYGKPMSVLMIDIDSFKHINDTYGHVTGDNVLCWLSDIFQDSIREVDYVARYGGEEFVILLPETTQERALQLVARLHKRIAKNPYVTGNQVTLILTISVGISTYPEDGGSFEALIRAADKAMYLAKETGRNQTRTASSYTFNQDGEWAAYSSI